MVIHCLSHLSSSTTTASGSGGGNGGGASAAAIPPPLHPIAIKKPTTATTTTKAKTKKWQCISSDCMATFPSREAIQLHLNESGHRIPVGSYPVRATKTDYFDSSSPLL